MKETLKRRLREIESEIAKISTQLEDMPPGRLKYHKVGNTYRFFQGIDKEKRYINKENYALAKSLAIKAYLSWRLFDLKNEAKAIKAYLKYFRKETLTEKMLSSAPAYSEILSKCENFNEKSSDKLKQELTEWQNAPYKSLANFQEKRTVKTPKENVRSKSEAIIAMTLYNHSIPYRYEDEILLGNKIWHPDFVIRHPKTGMLFIWEHFGLMDNVDYANGCANKLRTYIEEGYIPTVNMITTYETDDAPLDINLVNEMIKFYFEE